MPRRRRRFSWLGLFYLVVSAGALLAASVWLDSRGETARAVVRQKHEELTVHTVPLRGWDRWYRVGVEFPTSSGALGMATLTLPRDPEGVFATSGRSKCRPMRIEPRRDQKGVW